MQNHKIKPDPMIITPEDKMANEHELWLSSITEEAMDPDLPIIDPHHHLWDLPSKRFPFIYTPYLPDELVRDIVDSGHKVVQTVFIDCMSKYRDSGPQEMRPVGETEFVQSITKNACGPSGSIKAAAAIVSFADLTLGSAVRPVLEAHLEAGGGRFQGIRYATGWDESDRIPNAHTHSPKGLLLDPKFREGFACLGEYNLSFDAWLYHPQLTELTELARAFPGTTIILDHIGGPLGIGPYADMRDVVFQDWKWRIAELATCENVFVKLGGLGIPLCGFGWFKRNKPPTSLEMAEATAPYYLFCIEQFGIHRCMFESNFPVDKVSCSYNIIWNSFKLITKDFSAGERKALFYDTARRVYRLEP